MPCAGAAAPVEARSQPCNRRPVRGTPATRAGERAWWESPWFALALVLLAAVPLLYPPVPPLLDLPGHIGRYRIQLEYESWPVFREHFRMERSLIGNLGFDLLVIPLVPVLGLETAVRLIVLCIPPMTVAGFLLTAREVHGRIPPTALLALPLAYNVPFHFGFVNFALAMAFAFLLLPLWLALGRAGRLRLRAVAFGPLSLLLWLTHMSGWGVLCVLAFAAEFARLDGSRRNWLVPAWRAALACLPLAPPILALLGWRLAKGPAVSATDGWLSLSKLTNFAMLLRDRWMWFDLASLAVLAGLAGYALRSRAFALAGPLATGALLLLACYIVLPHRLFGGTYADMRVLPYLCAVALLAMRPSPGASASVMRTLAVAGLCLVLARTGGATASLYLYSREFERELAAVPHIAEGARVVALVGTPCRADWTMRRLDHLPGLAIARRHAFANDQWQVPGSQWVTPDYPQAGRFEATPSQHIRLRLCPGTNRWQTIDRSLAEVPRTAFDYLWLIRPPPYDRSLVAGLTPVWRSGSSMLYRIDHRPEAPPL